MSDKCNVTPSEDPQTDREEAHKEELKLVEAKTAVLFLKHSKLCTKNEYTQWLLRMFYQPCARKDGEIQGANILYLSRNKRRIWSSDFTINQDSVREINKHKNQTYVITPKTTILTISQENKLVYIIDLSSSLATVGNTRADILLSKVFQTLRNSLEGLVKPFSMQVSPTEKVIIQPTLRLTVMADCSQFGSNLNVIAMLVEHPTMRVFMQNVNINANNVGTIMRKLRSEFLSFQQDTNQFRKFMKRHSPNLGYNLDVGNDVGGIMDARSYPKQKKAYSAGSTPLLNESNAQKEKGLTTSTSEINLFQKNDTSFHSSKKEVWGMGKTGANLSRILHAGHFAMKMLPRDGRAQLILVTDGAMKSNVHDNTFVRQFAEEDITCHIIQVGFSNSFIPGRNFGFVPDTEILQFLARATGGSFTYSEKCMTKSNPFHLGEPSTTDAPLCYPVVQFVPLDKAKHISKPNMFHRQFLFKETALTRHHHAERMNDKDTSNSANRRDLSSNSISENRLGFNFPWDPYAKPPEGEWRLLKYRDYPLPTEFSHIIAARSREGFIIQSVTFDDANGSRHVDPGIDNLEAVDIAAVRKERVQIVMVLRWQPNITIEYRIRATWLPAVIGSSSNYNNEALLLSCGIFSRGKAPRAEIFVRTDAGFAHMLQNWDVFKRRAQMMNMVTGSFHFGEGYTAPLYSKIEKLKAYLIDIYEGDESLKTILGFPNKFWMSTIPGEMTDNQQLLSDSLKKKAFVDAFHDLWERIDNSEFRSRTRCWYDSACIDVLVGNVSPYMSPKLASSFNQEFIPIIEEEIVAAVEQLKLVLKEWATFESRDGTFVKIIQRVTTSPGYQQEENTKDYFSTTLAYPPSFCELRVRREYGRLVSIRILFFNTEVTLRRKIVDHIAHLLKVSEHTDTAHNIICQRPFSMLLMRDPKHFITDSSNMELARSDERISKNKSNRNKTWYLPVVAWLTSEYIVKDYLHHITWCWQTDNHQDFYHKENKVMPIHDLAFQFLCQARLDQGYQLVLPRPDSAQFYQEIVHQKNNNGEKTVCAIQYFIWKDSTTGKITTELWIEPNGNANIDVCTLVKNWTFEPDRQTISQLVTFDQIHAVGRSKGLGDFKEKRRGLAHTDEMDEEAVTVMMLPQLFDVSSVLRANKFVVASFQAPRYRVPQTGNIPVLVDDVERIHENSDTSGQSTPNVRPKGFHPKTHRYLRRHLDVGQLPRLPLEGQKLFSVKPDSLLNNNKEAMSKLHIALQNYALLHYFIERSLDYISNGEIMMSHHEMGSFFWQNLIQAFQKTSGNDRLASVNMIRDLRNTRCFVKVFDPRSFVVILFPSLESVVNGLLKIQEEEGHSCATTMEKSKYFDIFMFECVRQKPMKPTKNEVIFSTPFDETNPNLIQNLIEEGADITIRHMEHLIHESDGLGLMLRPKLFEGQSSTCQAHAQLSERVLRVAQDVARYYSKSFLKSFYACLMRGFVVDDEDLAKVLEVCNESTMEIDITEFIHISQQSIEGSDIQENNAQSKFNTIFNQYFELIQTKDESRSNLFYYKPPFSRSTSGEDHRISQLVDVVAYAQAPLLIKLDCVYSKEGEPDKVVPISTLPISYPQEYKDYKVSLHLVCLNMARTDLEDFTVSDPTLPTPTHPIFPIRSQPECFPSLSPDQQVALAEIDSRIHWLLVEETIHGLLKAQTTTVETLKHIEMELANSTPFVDYQTSMTIPLYFVKNHTESRSIFMDELEKDCNGIGDRKYKLRRLQDRFYVSEDSMYNMGDELSFSNSGSPIAQDPPITPLTEGDEYIDGGGLGSDGLCDGLGISISVVEKPGTSIAVSPDTDTPLNKRPLYWLILIPHENYVQLYFYSKVHFFSSVNEIIDPIREKINTVQQRTNRLVLLNYLQDTRMCSKYLEVPDPNDQRITYSDEDDESEEEAPNDDQAGFYGVSEDTNALGIEPNNHFIPGQFSCPIVYTKRFSLHWRLQPNVALKFLAGDVLRMFTVINRPNMFVIERDNSIVYCKIYEDTLLDDGLGSPNTVFDSPVSKLEEDPSMTPSLYDTRRELSRVPSTSPQLRGSTSTRNSNDRRELVLEVYGIELPSWIEKEFVNLIENRLISQITLNEIQQFFVRNPTSKPTLADVEFILPIQRQSSRREILRVSRLVDNPYTLLQYFKQSLLADNIRSLTGPYVSGVVKHYYNRQFYNHNTNGIQQATRSTNQEDVQEIPFGAFSFYYNCTKRLPGSSTPLELAAGQGLAGITLTLLDETGKPVLAYNKKKNNSRDINFDPDTIRHCLEEEFREDTQGTTYFHIWIDVWITGSVDGDALMQHIYECYKQSLCDYFIEKTVTIDLGAILSEDGALQKAVSAKPGGGRLSTVLRKKFIESVLFILQKASELKSPTVCAMDKVIDTTPWYMDDLIRYLDTEIRKINQSLRPTVAWTPLESSIWGEEQVSRNNKWELYRGFQYRQRQKIQSNIRLVAISGLNEFVEKLGNVSDSTGSDRRPSAVSDSESQRAVSRRSSGESANTDNSFGNRRSRVEDQSRGSIAHVKGPKIDSKKHCFLIMTLDVHRLTIYTYNWSESISQELFDGIYSIARRQEARNDILDNILHQKMGLFHHTESIKNVIEGYSSLIQSSKLPSSNSLTSSTLSAATPHLHLTSPKNKKPRPFDTPKVDATPSSRTSTRRNTGNAVTLAASILDLKDMIAFPTTAPMRDLENSRSGDVSPSSRYIEQEKNIDRILQKSQVQNTELDHALMDSITDSVADSYRSKDFDVLRRHGQPFLEAFLRRAKIQSAHRKALKVYLKWRKRYGDPQSCIGAAERLSRPEVSTIMRSSRVLHFCRTPLVFCNPEQDWSNLTENGKARITDWFKSMAHELLAEYAKYLEGADMQPIDFAKTENDGGEYTLRTSKFNLGKRMTAECPPTYLLRVFEGGSIICEVRLTSVFVSVTLYTLHRQYGRLDYNRFKRETRAKKRLNFKKFEENSGHFKLIIHINSFVYDFQLSYIQKMLDNPSLLPPELNIIDFLRKTAQLNQQTSPYCNSRVIHGFYEFESTKIDGSSFFENLLKNAPRYGLVNIPANGVSLAAAVSSSDLSFKCDTKNSNHNWEYTLAIVPYDDKNNEKVILEYFILIVFQGQVTPELMTKTYWVNGKNIDDISLPEEEHSMKDIIAGARMRIDSVVSEVIVRSKRAHDWSKLYSMDFSNLQGNDQPELVELMNEFDRIDIATADKNIAKLFAIKLNWNQALNTVIKMTRNSSNEFYENGNRHLLLYSARYMDFMIHLKVDTNQDIQGWLVSREQRIAKEEFEGAEKEQMNNLGKMFYYYMWKTVATNL